MEELLAFIKSIGLLLLCIFVILLPIGIGDFLYFCFESRWIALIGTISLYVMILTVIINGEN